MDISRKVVLIDLFIDPIGYNESRLVDTPLLYLMNIYAIYLL